MAFARSASGPAGLSINTSSANSLFGSGSTPAAGGMFGNTAASKPLFGAAASTTPQSGSLFGAAPSQPAGGLFGSNNAASQPQAGGLFGSTATSQPQTGGLFGATATSTQPTAGGLSGAAAPSQPQAGGLFGSTATSSQPQSGGLFGSTGGLFGNTATSQPASTGAMFGQPAATSQPQQSGGLFGGLGLGSQPAQNQPQTTSAGLFGGSTTNQGSSLFGGGLNAQSQNQPAPTSLFGGLGSNQNQQPQQQSTMFSQSQNQPQQPLAGGFLSTNQQQPLAPGIRLDLTNIKGSSRISDLHDELQKQLVELDASFQKKEQAMNEVSTQMPPFEKMLEAMPTDVEYCTRKLRGLADLMDGDVEAVSALKVLVEEDAEHAKLSFRAIDNLKLPPQYHNPGWPTKANAGDNRSHGNNAVRDSQDIVGYFSSTAEDLNNKLVKYQKNIAEIESHLRSVEGSTAQQIHSYVARKQGGAAAQNNEVRELAESFQDFERGILNVAGNVGSAREKVQSLQLGGFMSTSNGGATQPKRRNGIY